MNTFSEYLLKSIEIYKTDSSKNNIWNNDTNDKQKILSYLYSSQFYYPYIVTIDFDKANCKLVIKPDKVRIQYFPNSDDNFELHDDSDIFNISMSHVVPAINFELINKIRESMKDFACDSLIDFSLYNETSYYTVDKIREN